MSSFDAYNNVIEQKIANNSETFFDEEMKRTEINNTIREITNEYDLQEFKKRAEITFDANGKAAFPSDYKKLIKLWDVDANGVEQVEYLPTPEADFDRLAATSSYYLKVDYDTTDDTQKFFVRPIDAGTLQIRYYKVFTLLTDSNTETGLDSQWDETVALGASAKMFYNAGRFDEAQSMDRQYMKTKVKVYLKIRNYLGIKSNTRLRSKYERISQLGNAGSIFYTNQN